MAQRPVELILFRQLATSLAVPVFLVDEQGDLAFLNEAAERLLGIRLDEIDELPFEVWTTEFRPRDDTGKVVAPEDLPLVRALRDRKPAHGHVVITPAQGGDQPIEITAFPLEGGHGRLLGAVAMFWPQDG
jgi:PAS domain S-box-containing protein